MVELERRGLATAAVATEPFVDEALEQARLLGMPDYRMVYVPHPVQLLSLEELHGYADRVFEEIVERLTQPGSPVSRPPLPRAGAAHPRS
ncbi:MAG: hypothetical protein JOY56_00925 [Solirubrobacterales bacterium]|nr:hypothetical protein [Solirubrobacterales bacterium]MBV8944863.1 hypothetical protein [Solirubrobacterales bacterium]MBV9808950.1 hypothetical protein [Solirubrobacterales bacterium]